MIWLISRWIAPGDSLISSVANVPDRAPDKSNSIVSLGLLAAAIRTGQLNDGILQLDPAHNLVPNISTFCSIIAGQFVEQLHDYYIFLLYFCRCQEVIFVWFILSFVSGLLCFGFPPSSLGWWSSSLWLLQDDFSSMFTNRLWSNYTECHLVSSSH